MTDNEEAEDDSACARQGKVRKIKRLDREKAGIEVLELGPR